MSLSDYTGLWPFRVVAVSVVAVSVCGRYDLLPCDQIAYRLHVKRKRPSVCTYCGNLCLALYMRARGMHIYIIYDVPYPMTYVYMLCVVFRNCLDYFICIWIMIIRYYGHVALLACHTYWRLPVCKCVLMRILLCGCGSERVVSWYSLISPSEPWVRASAHPPPTTTHHLHCQGK